MIQLDNISWQYNKKDEFPTLSHISFNLPQGSFCWLLGSSGAGKSSLLKLLHLESPPTKGTMVILDHEITPYTTRKALLPLRQQIGIVYQNLRLIPNLSVAENIALPLRLQCCPEKMVRREVGAILRWFGLMEQARLPSARLSRGEQQRTAIARAVVHRPKIILADEPTNSLDEYQAQRILEMLVKLNQMGSTVIIATHNALLTQEREYPILSLERGQLRAYSNHNDSDYYNDHYHHTGEQIPQQITDRTAIE
ncbi:MAG: ATP-binding cassette domain-containing protein [Acetobacter sp.]|nr:ATP-binding cassette domain-containing protein [Acetobacter sp.]